MNNEELKAYDLAVDNHERAMARVDELEREVAALKSQPGGVVLPERKDSWFLYGDEYHHAVGFNSALDEVASLNQQPASGGEDERATYLAWYMETYSSRPVGFDGSSDYLAFVSGFRRGQARAALAQSERVPDIDPLLTISRKILAKLQHPTESVHAGDMWKLEEALAPFPAAPSPSKQGGV